MSQARRPQTKQDPDLEPDVMVVSHPPAEWNNFRTESSRGQFLRDLIENGKMDPVLARAQVDKDFAKRGHKRVKPSPRPASPEPSVASRSVKPKPSTRKTRRDPSPTSTKAPPSVQPKPTTRKYRRDASPALSTRSERNKSPHRRGTRSPTPYACSTAMVERIAPRPEKLSPHRESRKHRSPSTSPTRAYSPPPRAQSPPSVPSPPLRYRSPSPRRGRSPSPSVRSAMQDADEEWRKDMEREAKGDVEQSEWEKQLRAMEDYWELYGYSKPAPGAYWSQRFTQMDNWLEDNWRLVQDYGPGPSLLEMIRTAPNGPPRGWTLDDFRNAQYLANLDRKQEARHEERMRDDEAEAAEKGYRIPPPGTLMEKRTRLLLEWKQSCIDAELDQFEAEAAERGYRAPPRGTDYEERKRLMKDWLRNYNPSQQSGAGPSMANPYGMCGPPGYPQYGPGPSMGNPYASFQPPGYAQFNHRGGYSADDAYERQYVSEQRARNEQWDRLKETMTKQGYKFD